MNQFWGKFQAFIGSSVPEILVKILISAGYDNALSIAELDETDINVLQTYTQTNLKSLLDESTLYKNCEKFEFLPGHQRTILKISEKAKEYIEKKKSDNSTVQEFELLTDEEVNKLKENLLTKLNSVVIQNHLNIQFTENSLMSAIDAYISHNSRHSKNKPSYKCHLKCTMCD